MEYYVKSVVPIIESNYDKFTAVEKVVADFFIHNQKKMDFSIKNISELLFTSKSTLVRFAQKCGYHGYKEFIYQYEETFIEKSEKITGNATKFLIQDGKLLPPFVSISGLGENAAWDLMNGREGKTFISIEEVALACPKVSKTHIQMLKDAGAFGSLPDTSQISLF